MTKAPESQQWAAVESKIKEALLEYVSRVRDDLEGGRDLIETLADESLLDDLFEQD